MKMKRTIYQAVSERIGADLFDLVYTFDEDEAIGSCIEDWRHMTVAERKKSRIFVNVYKSIEVEEGESAKDRMLMALWEDEEWTYDPDDFIPLFPKEEEEEEDEEDG